MNAKRPNTTTIEQLKERYYGKEGTPKRKELERGYQDFKLGYMLREARINSGMTQQDLAQKVGMTKSYISKIENNIKEVRLSTLKKIVEFGLEGKIELKIHLS